MSEQGFPQRIDPRPCSDARQQANWQQVAQALNDTGLGDMPDIGASENPDYLVGVKVTAGKKKLVLIPVSPSNINRLLGILLSSIPGYSGGTEQVVIKTTANKIELADGDGAC